MTKFTAHTMSSCVPICRSELFEDVTTSSSKSDNQQPVDRLWIVPGHVFVSLDGGQRLLTFDCKPAGQQHVVGYGHKTLDFPALQPAVLDIFLTPAPANAAFIVQQNGHTQCWQFTSSLHWSAVAEFDLCDLTESEVTGVCLHQERNTLYWCERQMKEEAVYRICCKVIPEDILQLHKTIPETQVLVQDCPACNVLPLDNGVLIVPRHIQGHQKVCLFWRPSVMELVSVATIISSTVKDHYDMRSPLIFSDVLLNCLMDICQESTEPAADYDVKKDLVTGDVYILHMDGLVHRFHAAQSESKSQKPISVETVKVPMPEWVLSMDNMCQSWTVHKNVIAIATCHSVKLYCALEGRLIHELAIEDGSTLYSLATVRSPAFLLAMVTSTGIRVIQGGKVTLKSSRSSVLPADRHFQTEALQVALLAQDREERPSQTVSEQLAELHNKWQDLQAHPPQSQLSDTVDAYLAEFWRLEEQASQLGKTQLVPSSLVNNTKDMVKDAVARSRSMSVEAAMTELVWLSHKYPSDMLHVLLGDLDVEKVEMSVEDHAAWQSRLGFDVGDNITFELVCRLLYQERPQSLVPFVRNAQFVSEQAVGVSAFLRKKHKLQYYARAMECLPEPNSSKQPQEAAFAKAQIILTGAAEHGAELAVRFLLRHSQWSEAIQLLRQLGPDSPQHSSLFFLLLQQLILGQALSEYVSEVFSLLSSWKTFLPAFKVLSDNNLAQGSLSSPGLFCNGSPDIPLSTLSSHLMALLSEHGDHS